MYNGDGDVHIGVRVTKKDQFRNENIRGTMKVKIEMVKTLKKKRWRRSGRKRGKGNRKRGRPKRR